MKSDTSKNTRASARPHQKLTAYSLTLGQYCRKVLMLLHAPDLRRVTKLHCDGT